ncbi:kelch repeat-containing protein [Yeosuana sp. MJ-SS3]|uniref:Kelch repeat-containing protein n=1 Tax=Gilvirhabdus luticola TaxID=3079858 RepID=A0ABU3U765_9FLAO|nr:kelch repeat-containing protein [Yeosuana sp. MJ-SS3]MDU8886247.1 kelch repeat-containing protein [Yeosuana sp. MJ-SS3]
MLQHKKIILIICLQIPLIVSAFQEKIKENNPGKRWGHVLIYDQFRDQLVLFGGTRERGIYLNDTWIWDNKKWTKINTIGPSERGFCAATFHKDRNTIIIHGGRGNDRTTYGDTWEWDGKEWKQLDVKSGYIADHHQMVYLNDEKQILAYGGWNGKDVIGDTWFWNGKWEKSNESSPPKRASFGMAFNTSNNAVYLYGGLWVNGQYADIWKRTKGKWQPIAEPYSNSSLDHHMLIYDENRDNIIGFGGKNYRRQMQGKTFKIDNRQIETLSEEGPINRHSFGFTFASKQQMAYLYGGKKYLGDDQIALGDFWKWDGKTWNLIQ